MSEMKLIWEQGSRTVLVARPHVGQGYPTDAKRQNKFLSNMDKVWDLPQTFKLMRKLSTAADPTLP